MGSKTGEARYMMPPKRRYYYRLILMLALLSLLAPACDVLLNYQTSAERNLELARMHATQTAMRKELLDAQSTSTAMANVTNIAFSTAEGTPGPLPTYPLAYTIPASQTQVGGLGMRTTTSATGGQAIVYAEVDSNCRAGPSPDYERLGYLLIGESSELLGRNSASTWWYINEPRRTGIECWVWAGSTHLEGDASQAPIIKTRAKPVTDTSSDAVFSLGGIKLIKCGGNRTAIVNVKNTGNKRLESAWLRVNDVTQGSVISGPTISNTPFRNSQKDCTALGDHLNSGESRYIGASLESQNITNHKIQMDVKLCNGESLSGACDWGSVAYIVP